MEASTPPRDRMKPTSVGFDEATRRKLASLCELHDRSRSWIVRKAVDEYAAKNGVSP